MESKEDEEIPKMSPEEVEALFRGGTGGRAGGDEAGLTDDERKLRTAGLARVLMAAQHAWLSASDEVDGIAEKLGDGSRDPLWRLPMGDSGIVNFFLHMLAAGGLSQPLKVHALRVIGNSYENRARVVELKAIPNIIQLLADDSILAFVIPVLYNVCVDYEPAQLQASEAGLGRALVDIISGPRLERCQAFLNIVCKILALLVTQAPELGLAHPSTPTLLLRVATNPQLPVDLEDFCGLVSVALAFLTHEEFQKNLIASRGMSRLLAALSYSYSHYDVSGIDSDDAKQLLQIRFSFNQVVADISGLPEFPSVYPLQSDVVQTVINWLRTPSPYKFYRSAACLILGNVARSDETSTALVRDYGIQMPLITMLSTPYPYPSPAGHPESEFPPSQFLHAILSFLKNLAIPAANKPALSPLLEAPANILSRLWTSTDAQPQVQFAAVSLTRLLVLGCPTNVKRICAPLSLDPSSPANDRSDLSILIDLFERIDAEPTKMEIARVIAAVCRVLHSAPVLPILPADWNPGYRSATASAATTPEASSSPEAASPQASGETRRARFYDAHVDIDKPLSFMAQQTRFPALRSEAWFVFALMSRSEDGAAVVIRAIQPFEACRSLIEAITGRDMVDGHSLLSQSLLGAEGVDHEFYEGIQGIHDKSLQRQPGVGAPATPISGIEGLGLEPQQADSAQAANMANVNRENGLVLLTELLRRAPEEVPPFRRSIFEQLIQTGGELVLHQRSEEGDTEASNAGQS